MPDIHSRSPATPPAGIAWASLLAVSLLLGGCDNHLTNAARTDTPVSGGTLIYATDREPTCLDPHVAGDMPQVFLAQQVLDSLVSMDAEGHIGPWLAKSWEISPDGLTYTFHLRDDVRFTDGTPFNAAAVKANLDHMANPKTQSSTAGGYIRQYQRTDVLDGYTAQVHLATPYAAFLEVLAQGFLGIESPEALLRSRDVNCESPVGTGPFKVVRWDRQSQVVLERNPQYNSAPPTARHQGPAYLERIVWKFIQEPSVRFASLQAGEVDVIEALPPESHEAARRNPDLQLIIAQRPGNPTNGTLNIRRAPFNDIKVREAFVRSADIEGALKSVYFGEFPRAGGPLSNATRFYSPDFEHAQDYHPARAAQLLDEAGWTGRDEDGYRLKDGKRLQVRVILGNRTPPSEFTLWEQVQATTRQAGIELIMEQMSDVQATKRQADWDYDIRVGYWNTNTADVLRIIFSSAFIQPAGVGGYHQNTAGFSDPQFDDLVQQALATQDASQRQALYRQAQAVASSHYLQLTTYPQSTRLGIYKTTQGVRLEPSLAVTYLYDAWVNK
ncbi:MULTISPECIES: ABC transporter substrate-binding protein [unclassified Pseudomonas]|uniref:ABC transporter substrate-binding protein n=1 Tax=unclassified Pseudomonas TaxID=196821 RepID=UPI001780EB92|nr:MULTISPECIES: ABC transporter substrate-binding protein [unclassified Pseudomonas]MBD8624935.1 ABC transporter substrate-binding protein [Pseudomonas sp. CFBP 13727]MBD8730288.1 ABC transporter substrate-binding protein [Pseudomonas sp. CFBP 13710]